MPQLLLSGVVAVPLAPVTSRSDLGAQLRVPMRRNLRCARTCPSQSPWSSSPSSPRLDRSSEREP
ncbi:hypothetical protein ZEAMMB73_Zm00001d034336 [Zea mays]|uniref:Uncharacterized protein n=1 Tax=Zea mays TaxID=4577 RepID=A0A1D6L6P8_MAIZE|nr:hypothetical protein ZEAMMB73_Zm00001d034336 [Zea mays]